MNLDEPRAMDTRQTSSVGTEKEEFARDFFNQIESQIQFGDNKASLLIAGDALLLAISGEVIKIVSGCVPKELAVDCARPSGELTLAMLASLLLIASIACAFLAARPAAKHQSPPREFFLFSYLASISKEEFIDWYGTSSAAELLSQELVAIHGKAAYAARKFHWLRRAINASLLSLMCLTGTVLLSIMVAVSR
jgi:hypothetical protein